MPEELGRPTKNYYWHRGDFFLNWAGHAGSRYGAATPAPGYFSPARAGVVGGHSGIGGLHRR